MTMHPDKILIVIALIILLLAFAFKGRIFEEIALLRQTEVVELTEKMPIVYYYPLSQQERINVLQDYVEKLNVIQDRISKSILAKRFLDYRDSIIGFQNELLGRQQLINESVGTDEENMVSFSTVKEHGVFADPQFTKEALLHLACLIDNTFDEEQGLAVFILSRENDHLALDIIPHDNFDHFKKRDYQEFSSQISKEIFEGDTVIIHVDTENIGDNEYE